MHHRHSFVVSSSPTALLFHPHMQRFFTPGDCCLLILSLVYKLIMGSRDEKTRKCFSYPLCWDSLLVKAELAFRAPFAVPWSLWSDLSFTAQPFPLTPFISLVLSHRTAKKKYQDFLQAKVWRKKCDSVTEIDIYVGVWYTYYYVQQLQRYYQKLC